MLINILQVNDCVVGPFFCYSVFFIYWSQLLLFFLINYGVFQETVEPAICIFKINIEESEYVITDKDLWRCYQGILNNSRYTQREFMLKFSALLKAFYDKFTEESKNTTF